MNVNSSLKIPVVSRRHLLVRATPEGIIIENLSETNPAVVNEEEMDDKPRLLQNGDLIKIGKELLRYYEDASAHVLEKEPSFIQTEEEDLYSEEEEIPEESKVEEKGPQPQEAAATFGESGLQEEGHHTLFEEEESEVPGGTLAEIDFGVAELGRWLLKVIGGPNNGAEFYMQTGNSYIIGTDPKSCDILFNDTSVSRQHAKIIVTPEDTLLIEDLKSRNGVLINGELIQGQQPLTLSTIVTLGTTSFVIYDREGEMQTIISPLLPSIVKALQKDATKPAEPQPEETAAEVPVEEAAPSEPQEPALPTTNYGPYIVLAAIIALFVLAGIGTSALFHTQPVAVQTEAHADELIQKALRPFPAVRYTYNKTNNTLLLLGHVATPSDKDQLEYSLQGLKFIKTIDDEGVVIDEYVWQEMNSILSKTPAWRDITMNSPSAGQFVLSGYLPSRKQAEQLSSYINLNFPYLDLLKKQIVVEEDVITQITNWLQEKQLTDVVPKMNQREVTLSGNIPRNKQ